MASKRIWSESTLIWDKAGTELWNILKQFAGIRPGGDGDGDADFQDFDEERLINLQPAIMYENFNPNLSQQKIRILEIAGIKRSFSTRKEIRDDVSIFITEAKFRTK